MRTDDKLRTDPPICAADFGIPPLFAEKAENYVRWAVAQEREACAKVCDEVGMFHEVAAGSDLAWELAAAIRARARSTAQPPATPTLPPQP